MLTAEPTLRAMTMAALAALPGLRLAVVFGSVVGGRQRADSDLDVAVDAGRPLTCEERMLAIEALAHTFARPVDLVDLRTCGEPLLGQILAKGRRVAGSSSALGDLTYRHLLAQSDFEPLRERILATRRAAWIGP